MVVTSCVGWWWWSWCVGGVEVVSDVVATSCVVGWWWWCVGGVEVDAMWLPLVVLLAGGGGGGV